MASTEDRDQSLERSMNVYKYFAKNLETRKKGLRKAIKCPWFCLEESWFYIFKGLIKKEPLFNWQIKWYIFMVYVRDI